MGTKIIGPIVKSGNGPQEDSSGQCATGWCDETNGQFCAPPDWSAPGRPPHSSPKTDHKK